jgi:hypothetical protein
MFVLLGACCVVSCGPSSSGASPGGGATCGTVDPCGGNIVGTWKAADACITGAPTTVTMGTCTVATSYSVAVSGTATFNANLSYSADAQLTVTTTLSLPAACLSQGGVMLMCSDLSALISSSEGDAGANASCVSSAGGGCTCTLIETNAATASAGMYTTSGDSITTSDSTGGSSSSTSSYCVSGSQFHLISSSSTGVDGGAPETVDVVFTK